MKDFVFELTDTVIVDRQGLNALKSADMAVKIAEIYGLGKTVQIMDNTTKFFSDDNLFRAIKENDANLSVILEHRGIPLDQAQRDLITSFHNLTQHIRDQIEALKPPVPPYSFMPVPDGWTVEGNLRLTKTRVMKRNGNYYITLQQAQRLWRAAGRIWARRDFDASQTRRLDSLNYGEYGTYNYRPDIYMDRITIGCQSIHRYELEQLALAQGWEFPVRAAQD